MLKSNMFVSFSLSLSVTLCLLLSINSTVSTDNPVPIFFSFRKLKFLWMKASYLTMTETAFPLFFPATLKSYIQLLTHTV